MESLRSKRLLAAGVLGAVLAAAGFAAWVLQLAQGLLATTAMSNSFCWGLMIGVFAFLVGFGAGSQLVASCIVLSGKDELAPYASFAQAAAVGGAAGAAIAVIVDLGSPQNILSMLLHPNPASPLTWDMIALTAFLAVALVSLVALARSWRSVRVWALLGLIAAVALQVVEGVLFAFSSARAWWHSFIVPVDFLAVAAVCGLALVLAVSAWGKRGDALAAARRFAGLLAGAIAVHLVLALAEIVMLAFERTPASGLVLEAIGRYAPLYAAEIVLPFLAAVVLVVSRREGSSKLLVGAAVLTAAGMFAHRLMLLYPAFTAAPLTVSLSNEASAAWAYPQSTGLYLVTGDAFQLAQGYAPSAVEWASILLPVGCAVLVAAVLIAVARKLRA